MRYSILVFLLLLVPGLAHATACNSNCTFIRGDVNCSGAVDSTDVWVMWNTYPTNMDAADVNDDGVFNSSDKYMLDYYVSSPGSNPPPECPFPSAGLDCTPDNLETCCSPPTAANDALTHACGDTDVDPGTWDQYAEDEATAAGLCLAEGEVNNNTNGCSHDNAEGTMDLLDVAVTDPAHFTKKRLQNGVQFAYVRVSAIVEFTEGAACLPQYECSGSNLLVVDVHPENTYVEVSATPAAGGGASTIQVDGFSYLAAYEYRLTMGTQCEVEVLDDPTPDTWTSERIDISSQLAGLPPSDCADWKITEVNLHGIKAYFFADGKDITDNESVNVVFSAWVEYDWCEECD